MTRPAVPFHHDMEDLFGEHATAAENELWVGAVVLGVFACKLVYDLMKQYSPIYFGEYYTSLSKEKQIEWDNRGFSTVHAIFCGVSSGYLLLISDVFHDDTPLGPVAFRSTILSNFSIAFSTGYFLADLGMILWFYPHLGASEFVLHHFLSIGSVFLASYTAHAHFYILMVLFTEVTTPFMNIRWYLLTAGKKQSNLYLYNGFAMLLVWLVSRVLMFIYFFYHLYLHYDEIKQLYEPGFYYMFMAPPGLALMNFYWFHKIVLTLVKTVRRKKAE